ncbi:profilin family protein [Streptomyces sp. NPDC090112]|uniref:profilin family protein n=1 Tax=Streptomyces sp. NPDC090112 TaxID=3365949 RepID=UPI0037F9D89D
MSWDPNAAATVSAHAGTLEALAIGGVDGHLHGTSDRSSWSPSQAELQGIVTTLTRMEAEAQLVVQGERFVMISREHRQVVGKSGAKAIVAVATDKIVLIARVDESGGKKTSQALAVLGQLASHYASSGY